jgi:hypothetical protein
MERNPGLRRCTDEGGRASYNLDGQRLCLTAHVRFEHHPVLSTTKKSPQPQTLDGFGKPPEPRLPEIFPEKRRLSRERLRRRKREFGWHIRRNGLQPAAPGLRRCEVSKQGRGGSRDALTLSARFVAGPITGSHSMCFALGTVTVGCWPPCCESLLRGPTRARNNTPFRTHTRRTARYQAPGPPGSQPSRAGELESQPKMSQRICTYIR